ncbi:hypothetical protein S7335_770 [Synechococcus sp. PCC 7335]|uniref:AAA-like domain-containing protein n=1 Tax=Synechococcus sp. (strain ATCC 29403 / PCC 7335) TaxID=91464 RepID=UPI00017EC0B0|nr:AAA-like domain-containing protein [Synechococcus sp. PCC 7335]EDX83590.1 hypothetical protein S7335_770 [Synechococcus sp. PCC 7335]
MQSITSNEAASALTDRKLKDVEALSDVVEQLLKRRLEPLERFVLHQSWLKQTYTDMARASSYGADYIKHVGFRLWSELSAALNEPVGKKNLHLIFTDKCFQVVDKANCSDEQTSRLASQHILQLQSLLSELPPTFTSKPDIGIATSDTVQAVTVPSGPLPLGSPLYIPRSPLEETALSEITHPGCLLRIKAPRRTGKSSLLNRLLAYGETQGYRSIKLNLNEVDDATFSSFDRFLRWFCANLSLQLKLPSRVDMMWDEDIGSKVNCKLYVERYIFSKVTEPIVLGIDELNRVFEYVPTAHDFLPMLRVWHEQSKDDPVWQKLRLVLVHSTDFYVSLKLNQSPFNVGLAVNLPPFTLEQLQDLARRYGLETLTHGAGAWQLKSLHHLIAGHPYLSGLAFYALRQKQTTLNDILATATMPDSIYRQHLQRCLVTLQSDSRLACLYYRVVIADEQISLDAISAYKLESLGLIRFENALAKPSCALYQRYFSEQLRSVCS